MTGWSKALDRLMPGQDTSTAVTHGPTVGHGMNGRAVRRGTEVAA